MGFVFVSVWYISKCSISEPYIPAETTEHKASEKVADTARATTTKVPSSHHELNTTSSGYAVEHPNALVQIARPRWRQDDTLLQSFDALNEQAQSGDLVAAYVLGMNLRHCYYVPDDNAALADKLLQASEFKDNGEALADIQQSYDYCEGVTRSERNRFYHYLERAAENGSVPAQEAIAELTPELYMAANNFAEISRDEYVEKRQRFVRQQVDFLTSAAQHGSLKAPDENNLQ